MIWFFRCIHTEVYRTRVKKKTFFSAILRHRKWPVDVKWKWGTTIGRRTAANQHRQTSHKSRTESLCTITWCIESEVMLSLFWGDITLFECGYNCNFIISHSLQDVNATFYTIVTSVWLNSCPEHFHKPRMWQIGVKYWRLSSSSLVAVSISVNVSGRVSPVPAWVPSCCLPEFRDIRLISNITLSVGANVDVCPPRVPPRSACCEPAACPRYYSPLGKVFILSARGSLARANDARTSAIACSWRCVTFLFVSFFRQN